MSNKANLRRLSILISVVVLATAAAKLSHVEANDNRVIFELTDEPGRWFKSTAGPIAGTHSLAVARPGLEVKFTGKSHAVHTMTSLIYWSCRHAFLTLNRPKGPGKSVLRTPGLYVFVCKIHPYMLGAVLVDDPQTAGLDLGKNRRW